MSHDYTLVLEHDALVTAHAPDCPDVDRARVSGLPLLTMLDCAKPLGNAYRKHSCCQDHGANQEQNGS
jgi:hypothetical protein